MSFIDSCVGPKLMTLFGEAVEALGDEAELEEAGHRRHVNGG